MATNLTERIEDLARQIAVDQVAQDINNNQKFAPKASVEERLTALEAKLNELISVAWTLSPSAPMHTPPQALAVTFPRELNDSRKWALEIFSTSRTERQFPARSNKKSASRFSGGFFMSIYSKI